jgi:putative sterol carrier protein
MTIDPEQVQEMFMKMQSKFQPDKAEGLRTAIQLHVTNHDKNYWLEIYDGKVDLHEGEADSPRMTLSASATDFSDVIEGDLNPMQAFMSGKFTVKGDMGLAMKLQSIFGL